VTRLDTVILKNQMWPFWALGHWKLLLERHGRYYPVARPMNQWPVEAVPGPIGECFVNAAKLACKFDGVFLYMEGLAERPSVRLVAEHAWVLDLRTQEIIDPTWRDDGIDYVGVAYGSEGVRKNILSAGGKGGMVISASCAQEVETRRHIVAPDSGAIFRFPRST
jgi:hypothetical protein